MTMSNLQNLSLLTNLLKLVEKMNLDKFTLC